MRKKIMLTLIAVSVLAFTYGCGSEPVSAVVPTTEPEVTVPAVPTSVPTEVPTSIPTNTPEPTKEPTAEPTATVVPTMEPTSVPTEVPTSTPTAIPTVEPTIAPTEVPNITVVPTETPIATVAPTSTPTPMPTATPIPTTTVEPTATPSPTAIPTVAPTATPKPTPIPGDDIGVEFGDKVTLDSGVEMSVLTDYNNAGIYSDDVSIYGWYGDGQDNRDATAQKDKEMDALEDAVGVTATHGTGFYVGNFATEFYWGSVGSTPDLALYRDVDNKCYYLAINYDLTEGSTVTPTKARDVLRMLLSICSSNPIELENWIYNDCFITNNPIAEDTWAKVGDSKVCFPSYDESIPYAKWIYVIKQ